MNLRPTGCDSGCVHFSKVTESHDESERMTTERQTGMDVSDSSSMIRERLTVLLAQGGDRSAFSMLVEAYDRRLLYFVRRILGEFDGAYDVLQSVWLIAYRKLGQLSAPDAFRVWLYRIAHDQAIDELRKKSKRPVLFEDVKVAPVVDVVETDNHSFEDAELIHQALSSLSIDHRRVITLKFLEEMSVEEIAQVVDCSAGTVKSRLHYAKAALRSRIEELANG